MSSANNYGVHEAVQKSALAALLDGPETFVLRHYRPGRLAAAVCGATDGIAVSDPSAGVTCDACRADIKRRQEKRDLEWLRRVAKKPIRVREFDRCCRNRLEAAGLITTNGAWLVATAKGLEQVRR